MNFIGIDIGGTAIKAVTLGGDGSLEHSEEHPYSGTAEEMMSQVAALADSMRGPETRAIGVGIAGLVRWPDGVFVWGPHVRGENLAVRDRLEHGLGLPVLVDNDANCASLAELTIGAAVGASNAVVMTLGTGIGAGIIAEGAVYRGGSFAGEVGHMTMIPDGDPCACGRRGCWETLVSGRRFGAEALRIIEADPNGALARIVGDGEPSGSHLGAAAAEGDEAARDAVVEAGVWLGRGIANLAAILDPELVFVGGAAVAFGEVLLAAAREEFASFVEGADHRRLLRIEVARCGPRAGAIGAALMALETGKGNE